MPAPGPGKRLVIYVGESDSWQGRSLYMSILEALRKAGVAGATVTRGLAGYGAHSVIHTWRIERLSTDLPVIITVIDAPENIERALTLVKPMVREGLITLEDVEVVKYTHRYLQPLPADRVVSEIMTRQVTTVTPDTPAVEVIELLLGQLFRAVPVVDTERRVVGIITEDDLLEKARLPARLDALGRLEEGDVRAFLAQVQREKTAHDIMTHPVLTVRDDETLGHAVQKMLESDVTRLPVVDGRGRLVGVVSRLDVLRAAAGAIAGPQEKGPAPRPGQTIGELMAPIPTVHVNDDVTDVLEQMLQTDVHYVIVLDAQGRAAGVITESDLVVRVAPTTRRNILKALAARLTGREQWRGDVTAGEIMSRQVLSAPGDTTVPEAITLMLREGRRRIVVVDAEGYPVGIVDRQTLLAASLGA